MKPSWMHVLRDCLAEVQPLGTELMKRRAALGRILAQDIQADRDYPAGDLGMMDGYAIGSLGQESYKVEGENRPGDPPGQPLAIGNARRIFTGAELPSGATRVIPQEMVRREGERLYVTSEVDSLFVRRAGSEACRGEIVLKKGIQLGAVELAILATMGVREVEVTALPRVAHLITGNEIVSPDHPLPAGKLRDSNSDLVVSVLAGSGFGVMLHARVSDDRDLLFERVREMADACDFFLISGGASVGDHDHARPALESSGFQFIAHGLHIRPGRPAGLARRGRQWAVALPGNPLSHLAILHLLVLPLLKACGGWRECGPQLIHGTLAGTLSTEVPGRDTFWPATAALRDGAFHLRPGRFLSSGDLMGVAGINAMVSLPAQKIVPLEGQRVYFLPLSPFFA